MTPRKQITNEDLVNLETKITKEQQEARHNLAGQVQNYILKVDEFKEDFAEHKTNNALLEQSMKNIEKKVDDIHTTMKDFIKAAYDTFATKKEHNENVNKIEELEKANKNNLYVIIWFMVSIILSLIWVIWSNLNNIVK